MSVRQRALLGGVGTVLVAGSVAGAFVASAPEHEVEQVQVEDTAQVLFEPDLLEGLAEVRFHEPTTVGVFTHRGGSEALTQDRALNDAVLAFAREEREDWLAQDGQTWADGLYLVAVDPEGRLVGTYFGEDREVGEDEQAQIQDATKDDFRAGRWTEGVVAGVSAGADRIGAPFIRQTGGLVLGIGAALATLVGAGSYLGVGLHRARRSRRSRAAGDTAMARVVRDQEVTELHARLLPADSRYGGLMLRRFDDYTRGFRELTELSTQARAVPERAYDTPQAVERLAAYEERATSLDHLDDVIADTAALLNRDSTWPEAWDRQADPVRADLEGVGPLLEDDLPAELRDLPEVQAVREFASAQLVDLDRLRGDLETREVSPDDALDHLRSTRDGLSTRLDALAGAVAREFGEDEDERTTMRTALSAGQGRRVHEPTIIATADPAWIWFGTSSFRSGLTTGRSEVEQSRSSSSGGSTSGYSSGGSFSGAGSSSRF